MLISGSPALALKIRLSSTPMLVANDRDIVALGAVGQLEPEHPIKGQRAVEMPHSNPDVIDPLDCDRVAHPRLHASPIPRLERAARKKKGVIAPAWRLFRRVARAQTRIGEDQDQQRGRQNHLHLGRQQHNPINDRFYCHVRPPWPPHCPDLGGRFVREAIL
jgi:hypothetical protein